MRTLITITLLILSINVFSQTNKDVRVQNIEESKQIVSEIIKNNQGGTVSFNSYYFYFVKNELLNNGFIFSYDNSRCFLQKDSVKIYWSYNKETQTHTFIVKKS